MPQDGSEYALPRGACDINLDYVKDPPEGEFANDFEIYNQETVASGLNVEFCLKCHNC
jgi:hypothetical protein